MPPLITSVKILLVVCLSVIFSLAAPLHACEQFQAKVDRYTQLKRAGGNARQMNRWQAQRTHYAERYRECLRDQPTMHRATGASGSAKRHKPDTQKQRQSTSDDPVVLQLLATCNFWIRTANQHPSAEHRSYRDTACRALEEAQRNPPALAINHVPAYPLSACIKPGNVIDEEVQACMNGTRVPDWQ